MGSVEVDRHGYIIGDPSKFDLLITRFRRPIAAAVTSVALITGAGAMAEQTEVKPQNPNIKTETGLNGIERPDEVSAFPEIKDSDNSADTPIIAKGLETVLFSSKTNEYTGTNVSDSKNGERTAETLSYTENEKSPEQMTIENIVNYMNATPARAKDDIGYTDEDIKKDLIIVKDEFTDDLGLSHIRNIQGRILGFLETNDRENLIVFLGTKDTQKNRFVTPVRIPLYALQDGACPLKFSITRLSSNSWYGGIVSTNMIKNKEIIADTLSYGLNKNFIFDLYTSDVSNSDIEGSKQYGDTTFEYTTDMKENSAYIRTLTFSLYRNKIRQKLEYTNPKSKIVKITSNDKKEISAIIASCREVQDDKSQDIISTIPLTLGLHFF